MAKKKVVKNKEDDMTQEIRSIIQNGLSDAILGFDPLASGNQISQVDTVYKNSRWYLVSNFRQVLSQLYVEHGLIKTIIDVPVDDGLGRGFDIITQQLSPEQISDLIFKMEENDDMNVLAEAMKWNRLFGGAGIIILTEQDQTKALDITKLEKDAKVEFRAVDMWELFWDLNATGDTATNMDQKIKDVEVYSYYGEKLHSSRVMKLVGNRAPSFIRPRLRGWGVSVVETLIRSINQYLKATDLSFEVLDEFKLDIYKIKGLTDTLLSPKGAEKVYERVSLANKQKNYQNAITMDAEDDYQQKQLSFSGIAETMEGIRIQVASDLRMPMTKLFGISSAGFNSGEDDIENYNSMVESEIRAKSKFHLIKMIKVRCLQLFGFIPDDLKVNFKSMRILSTDQEETVKDKKFARILQARQAGEITAEEFRSQCNKGELLPLQLVEDENVLENLKGEKDGRDLVGRTDA